MPKEITKEIDELEEMAAAGFEPERLQLATMAKEGNGIAAFKLGRLYEEGLGVKKDEAQAVIWYELAANAGNADAQNTTGWMYEVGIGVEADPAKAAKWYQQAADQNLASAQKNLGRLYLEGIGVEKDLNKAKELFRQAAEQGHIESQLLLGKMYREGQGDPVDQTEAMKWYRSAADQGDAEAQLLLGDMYYIVNPFNPKEAMEWYRKSADQGNADAQVKLVSLYETNGLIIYDSNKAEALRWFSLAAELGSETASEYVERLRIDIASSLTPQPAEVPPPAGEQKPAEPSPHPPEPEHVVPAPAPQQDPPEPAIAKPPSQQEPARASAPPLNQNVNPFIAPPPNLLPTPASEPQEKMTQLKRIIYQINNNIRGKQVLRQGRPDGSNRQEIDVSTKRWTHDTKGPKIQVLEHLEILLNRETTKFSDKDLDVIIKFCMGIYQVKRNWYGRNWYGFFTPDSAKEFAADLLSNKIKPPQDPMQYTMKDLKEWTQDGVNTEQKLKDLIEAEIKASHALKTPASGLSSKSDASE